MLSVRTLRCGNAHGPRGLETGPLQRPAQFLLTDAILGGYVAVGGPGGQPLGNDPVSLLTRRCRHSTNDTGWSTGKSHCWIMRLRSPFRPRDPTGTLVQDISHSHDEKQWHLSRSRARVDVTPVAQGKCHPGATLV